MRSVMSISLPDGLRERLRERPEVNWSGVAVAAFRERLEELGPVDEPIVVQGEPEASGGREEAVDAV